MCLWSYKAKAKPAHHMFELSSRWKLIKKLLIYKKIIIIKVYVDLAEDSTFYSTLASSSKDLYAKVIARERERVCPPSKALS